MLALCNVLILRGDITIPQDWKSISYEHLRIINSPILSNCIVDLLGEALIRKTPKDNPDELSVLTFHQTLNDVISVIPTLQHGLNVNLYFDSPEKFEVTSQLCLFDILHVQLYHAWVGFNVTIGLRSDRYGYIPSNC